MQDVAASYDNCRRTGHRSPDRPCSMEVLRRYVPQHIISVDNAATPFGF